jgi:hypothetical protein
MSKTPKKTQKPKSTAMLAAQALDRLHKLEESALSDMAALSKRHLDKVDALIADLPPDVREKFEALRGPQAADTDDE